MTSRQLKKRTVIVYRKVAIIVIILYNLFCGVHCADPKFDPSTRMRLVLVPADAQVGSVIYRLRASDEEFDYPLTFELVGDASSSTVKIDSLPCTKYNSVCQANVLLQRRLEPGRYYDFQVSVRDSKGGMAIQPCSITATNFTTPHEHIFPHRPGIIMLPEDAKRGTELDYLIARKNPLFQKPVYLELWGSPLFAIRQKLVSPETTEGTIFLLGSLDFEKQAMYHLNVLAIDAYAEPGQDTRNIAGLEIVVIVQDVQDQPPVFTSAPPVTKLTAGILPGDKILQVHAEDGDKGSPREIRYGLVSEGNPFTSFFDINDTSGEIFLMRPLEDIAAITHVGDPVLLTVIAEELKVGRDEPPAMASTVQLAFFLPERTNSAPYFEIDHYVSRIDENSPQGTALTFVDPYVPRVYDDDTGKNGVFSLTLLSNNGTFEISPNVVERSASFLIRVRDNILLDYEERTSVQFQIVAQELGPATNLSAIVNVTVYINDVNDNAPIFSEAVYTVELPENATVGTRVVQVDASDVDTGPGGRVRYTAILGYLNTSLNLDAETGLVKISTNNHGFDRELMPEFHLYVEARDNDGTGNRAQVPLIIKLLDVNDEPPLFEKDLYEFILMSDLRSFTSTAVIHANDKDATPPNNQVQYEIINGNYDNKFHLDKITGEITVRDQINYRDREHNRNRESSGAAGRSDTMFVMTARAYDLGVPVRFSTTTIRIYPPESRTRTMTFVVPGLNPDKAKTEETLSTITGGKVIIHDVRPLQPDEPGAHNIANSNPHIKEHSVVTATVLYDNSAVVDITQIQKRLTQHNSSYAIMSRDLTETDTLTPLQTLYKAENKLLFWLLILLATLVALTILILLLCCICSWCPLYGAASKRIINISRTEDDVHLVHREMANGKQTKSVQVAEWMGRREAWSAEKPPDPRTKPTGWEFRGVRDQSNENLDERPSSAHKNYELEQNRRAPPAEHPQHRNFHQSTKEENHLSFHNSRTNLINERDIYVEDVIDGRQLEDGHKLPHPNTHVDSVSKSRVNVAAPTTTHFDDDSIRRHEIDRGSDVDYNTIRSSMKNKREYFIKDGNIEILQLMTRDNKSTSVGAAAAADGEEENIYVNVPIKSNLNATQPQFLMLDNTGKEILMRRFIEEQPDGKQVIREHYQIIPGGGGAGGNGGAYIPTMPNEVHQSNPILKMVSGPNSVVYSQTEPEVKVIHTQPMQVDAATAAAYVNGQQLRAAVSNQSLTQELENSLKQQNELLRKILLDKEERLSQNYYAQQEVVLETQSLPGQSMAIATQTDCDAATQTDADVEYAQVTNVGTHAVVQRRRARSENDDSMSEDDYEYVRFSPPNSPEGVYWIKRKRHKSKSKYRTGRRPAKGSLRVVDIKRKIRTPIKEEDDDVELKKPNPPTKPARKHGDNRNRRSTTTTTDSSAAKYKTEYHFEIADDERHYHGHRRRGEEHLDGEEHFDYEEAEAEEEMYEEQEEEEEDSLDSDADEIVIRTSTRYPLENRKGPDENRFKIHVSDGERHRTTNGKRIVLRTNEGKSNVKHPTTTTSQITHSNGTSNINNHKQRTVKEAQVRLPSELDAKRSKVKESKQRNDHENGNIPKYMEWYYDKKKSTTTQGATGSKKNLLPESKKKISKIDVNIEPEEEAHGKSKPEPAPRRSSPQKGHHMLKEDIMKNKQHKPKIETDANHPLVQHSEHRFERETTLEVPLAPTKLPHYMYPETPPFAIAKDQSVKPKPSPIKETDESKANPASAHPDDRIHMRKVANTSQKLLNAATLEDDHDSGIAMNSLLNSMGRRHPITEKKSVFSIAYDDVSRVKKINSGSHSPQQS